MLRGHSNRCDRCHRCHRCHLLWYWCCHWWRWRRNFKLLLRQRLRIAEMLCSAGNKFFFKLLEKGIVLPLRRRSGVLERILRLWRMVFFLLMSYFFSHPSSFLPRLHLHHWWLGPLRLNHGLNLWLLNHRLLSHWLLNLGLYHRLLHYWLCLWLYHWLLHLWLYQWLLDLRLNLLNLLHLRLDLWLHLWLEDW